MTPVGTDPGRHLGRTARRCARPPAHHPPLEDRRSRRRRLRARVGASSLTLGGLLKHLAFVEDYPFTTKLTGERVGEPWDFSEWDDEDWPFTSAARDTPDELYALWEGAVVRSRARLSAALTDGGLDQLAHVSTPDGRHASLRRLVCDLIEEYGRHTGHADLLREAVDGRVGEDPPDDWRPSTR